MSNMSNRARRVRERTSAPPRYEIRNQTNADESEVVAKARTKEAALIAFRKRISDTASLEKIEIYDNGRSKRRAPELEEQARKSKVVNDILVLDLTKLNPGDYLTLEHGEHGFGFGSKQTYYRVEEVNPEKNELNLARLDHDGTWTEPRNYSIYIDKLSIPRKGEVESKMQSRIEEVKEDQERQDLSGYITKDLGIGESENAKHVAESHLSTEALRRIKAIIERDKNDELDEPAEVIRLVK
jgi:hypothetical protein